MPIELIEPSEPETRADEYILVDNTNPQVLDIFLELHEATNLAATIRKAGGSVTIFKATKY